MTASACVSKSNFLSTSILLIPSTSSCKDIVDPHNMSSHLEFGILLKVTVDLRGVFWGRQYSALCINGKYINLYIIGELISLATRLC